MKNAISNDVYNSNLSVERWNIENLSKHKFIRKCIYAYQDFYYKGEMHDNIWRINVKYSYKKNKIDITTWASEW